MGWMRVGAFGQAVDVLMGVFTSWLTGFVHR